MTSSVNRFSAMARNSRGRDDASDALIWLSPRGYGAMLLSFASLEVWLRLDVCNGTR